MKHYEAKMHNLYLLQNGKCSACGKDIGFSYALDHFVDGHTNEKLDFDHNLKNTKLHRERYPLFIDSLLNGRLMHNSCNCGNAGRRFTDYQAGLLEAFLQEAKTNHIMSLELLKNYNTALQFFDAKRLGQAVWMMFKDMEVSK